MTFPEIEFLQRNKTYQYVLYWMKQKSEHHNVHKYRSIFRSFREDQLYNKTIDQVFKSQPSPCGWWTSNNDSENTKETGDGVPCSVVHPKFSYRDSSLLHRRMTPKCWKKGDEAEKVLKTNSCTESFPNDLQFENNASSSFQLCSSSP